MAKKKRDMTDHEHRVYKQNHGYDFPLDEEQAKIARERSEHRKLRKQSARKQRPRTSASLARLNLLSRVPGGFIEPFSPAHSHVP